MKPGKATYDLTLLVENKGFAENAFQMFHYISVYSTGYYRVISILTAGINSVMYSKESR